MHLGRSYSLLVFGQRKTLPTKLGTSPIDEILASRKSLAQRGRTRFLAGGRNTGRPGRRSDPGNLRWGRGSHTGRGLSRHGQHGAGNPEAAGLGGLDDTLVKRVLFARSKWFLELGHRIALELSRRSLSGE